MNVLAQDLARLHARCFTTPRPWRADEFTALLASPGVFLTGDGTAFALGRVILDEAELLTLAVAPAVRRGGLGRAHLAAFEARARAQGTRRAFLEVAADNAAAIALYRGAGYDECGRRAHYYRAPDGQHIHALVLSKPL